MSNNREERIYKDKVHLFLAIQRTGTAKDKRCIRMIIKHNEEEDLKVFEAKLKALGGKWRIHRTVNARDVKKAYKNFMKRMIDFPEKACNIDTEWRTALLQRECKAENYFMLDVDTKIEKEISDLIHMIGGNVIILKSIESPKGYHIITEPFDTREIIELEYVTLLRDGYFYVKTVGEK